MLPCATGRSPADGRQSPALTAPGAPPILVIGNTGDAATRYDDAVFVRRHAGRRPPGVRTTCEGHTAYGRDDCVDDAIHSYLSRPDRSRPRTRVQWRRRPYRTLRHAGSDDQGEPMMEYNLAQVHEAVERRVPDRECIVFRDRRLTYRAGRRPDPTARQRARGAGAWAPSRRPGRARPATRSGQDHLALYLHNGNEYLEAMLGAYKARVAPFNVNYRYVAEELALPARRTRAARAIVYHSAFAPTLAEVRDRAAPTSRCCCRSPTTPATTCCDGRRVVRGRAGRRADRRCRPGLADRWSPDDLYILYTGGTTGMPKGVLWRQADIFVGAMGGRRLDNGEEWASLDEIVDHGRQRRRREAHARPAVHARRRPLDGVQRLHRAATRW